MTAKHLNPRKTFPRKKRISVQEIAALALLIALGALMGYLVVTGHTWRAIAYAMATLFGLLVALAVYFWSTLLFSGFFAVFTRRQTAAPWQFDTETEIPEYDLDPGLELVAAGILVYREARPFPDVHFRHVPLAGTHAIRPFLVARTSADRRYPFVFHITDAHAQTRLESTLETELGPQPAMIVPPVQVRLNGALLDGQTWRIQVLSGPTVITTIGFTFSNGTSRPGAAGPPGSADTPGHVPDQTLSRLRDQALQHEAATDVPVTVFSLEDQ